MSRHPVIKILFDESHNELLRSQEIPDDDEIDTWSKLNDALIKIGHEVTSYSGNVTVGEELTAQLLSSYKVGSSASFMEN
ncbi:hypothetical protein [Nostoc sp.]